MVTDENGGFLALSPYSPRFVPIRKVVTNSRVTVPSEKEVTNSGG